MTCKRLFSLLLIVLVSVTVEAEEERWNFGSDYVKLDGEPGIRLDVRYATKNNFTGKNLYGNYRSCYLHRDAAEKLKQAVRFLHEQKSDYDFLVFDCLRPRRIQKILYEFVRGTAQQPYVANPAGGSIHNFGFAIDLSLVDGNGNELDMGTQYDDFTALARPDREAQFFKAGKLTAQQLRNRRVLRDVMSKAGFRQLALEWWHYDALPGNIVRKNYRIVE